MLLNRSSLYGTYKQRNHSYCNVLSQIFFVEKKLTLDLPSLSLHKMPDNHQMGSFKVTL